MLRFKKCQDDAVIPTKAGPNEIGFDLTITSVVKEVNSNTKMYDTGIAVEPSGGIYIEIAPRSSLSKTGYILTNSIGIIDPTYRGTLKVVLTKISSDAPELELPCNKFQLIPRMIVDVQVNVADDLSETERGSGGFGSTDKR